MPNTLKLTFAGNSVGVELTPFEVTRLHAYLVSWVKKHRPPPSPTAQAALAVDAARLKGTQ